MSLALKEARERAEKELLALADLAEARQLTEDETDRIGVLKAEIVDLRSREALQVEAAGIREAQTVPAVNGSDTQSELRGVAKQPAEGRVEARAVSPYASDNTQVSWFRDRATLANPEASNAEVEESRSRLTAHYDAVGDEGAGREVRTYSVGTSAQGGYLAAPQYLQGAFADLLAAGRPTADLVGKMALPAAGQTFYIPTQDGATAVAVTSENSTLTETSATFNQIQVDACRVGGIASLPNWLVDRSFPGADQIVLRDLAKQYAVYIDGIVLNSSTSNRKGLLQETGLGGATATAGTATIATLWPALLNAVNDVASGVFAYPDAIIMHPRRWAWLAAQLDVNSRPVLGSLNPQNSIGNYNGASVPGAFTGPMASGSLLGIPVYLDANIPTTFGAGTDEDRIIVMKKDEPLLMESTPKFAVSFENQFAKDQLIARVTGDVAFTCARRKAAVSIISGTALNDTV